MQKQEISVDKAGADTYRHSHPIDVFDLLNGVKPCTIFN